MKRGTKIIFVILLVTIVFSSYQIYKYLKEENENKKLNDDLANKAIIINPDSDETQEIKEATPISVNFEILKQENKDIIGWIYSEDTPINYPVVQGKDNEKYIHTLINGKTGSAGTLFMDYRNNENLNDKNSIIYGHNMKNSTMFGTIQKYRKQTYYDSHKTMYYLTPEKNYKLELFSGFTTSINSDIYDLKILDQKKINTLKKQSDFISQVKVSEEDKFLTLSTCAYDYDNARYVLIGVLVEI